MMVVKFYFRERSKVKRKETAPLFKLFVFSFPLLTPVSLKKHSYNANKILCSVIAVIEH